MSDMLKHLSLLCTPPGLSLSLHLQQLCCAA